MCNINEIKNISFRNMEVNRQNINCKPNEEANKFHANIFVGHDSIGVV